MCHICEPMGFFLGGGVVFGGGCIWGGGAFLLHCNRGWMVVAIKKDQIDLNLWIKLLVFLPSNSLQEIISNVFRQI